MSNITVWTKQHENVLKELETAGRYIAKQEYIRMDLKEQAPVVLEAYDWLVKHGPDRANKLADVEYPVWVCDPTFTSGRRSSGSGSCKIGATGAPGNWKRKLWQERYFYGRFPGGRRHGKCQKRSSDAQQSTRRFLGTADVRRRLHGRQVPLL